MSLPQLRTLAQIAGALDAPVRVGGSFARGEADAVSDLDLTFTPASSWNVESLGGLLTAVQRVPLGFQILYHGVARDGTVVDLLPGPAPSSAVDAHDLAAPVAPDFEPSPLETGVLADFWIHTHKHRKPLARGLDPMVILGLAHDRTFLMRLWSLAEGEDDPGANLGGIYAMVPLVRRLVTPQRRALLGMPTQTRREIVEAIEAIQAEVAGLGLAGAERVERIVRASACRS